DSGSDSAGSDNALTPDTPDNGSDVAPDDELGQLKIECGQAATARKWIDARNCADRIATLDSALAKKLKADYNKELENEIARDKLGEAIRAKNYAAAKKQLAAIGDTSVYSDEAKQAFDAFETSLAELYAANAAALKARNNCKEIDKLYAEAKERG